MHSNKCTLAIRFPTIAIPTEDELLLMAERIAMRSVGYELSPMSPPPDWEIDAFIRIHTFCSENELLYGIDSHKAGLRLDAFKKVNERIYASIDEKGA